MKFGENLYHLRKNKKMSQEQLAEKIGVSRQSVSKWETGEAYPEMENILKICKIFHCKINDIIHDDLQDINSLDEDVKMSIVKFEKEKQKRLKVISKIIYVIARIGKILSRVGAVGLIVALIFGNLLIYAVNVKNENEIDIKLANISIEYRNIDGEAQVISNEGNIHLWKFETSDMEKIVDVFMNNSKVNLYIALNLSFVMFIAAIILLSKALGHLEKLFDNIYNGDTPFTLDNVHHIKTMTYFMIAITILSSFGNGIGSILTKHEMNMNIGFNLITILFLYSIAYIFEYGYQIQLDSKGKIYGENEKE